MSGPGDMDIKLKWIYRDRDRHGNVRIYFWRNGGRKVRIREAPGSAEFLAHYRTLIEESAAGLLLPPQRSLAPAADTFGWLVNRYKTECQAFKALDELGQRTRIGVIENMLAEPIYPGAPETFRDFPLTRLSPKAMRALRDRTSGLPGAANSRVRALRGIFKWASSDEDGEPIVDDNPCRGLSYVRTGSTGHHTWSDDEVQQFEDRHPIGTKPRLAMALMLYTGFRKSDLVELGRQHIRDGWIRKRQFKGRRQRRVMLEIPVLPELAEVIAAGPCGDMTLLVTEYGKPFTANGFGGWFRDRCDEAGLRHCSAHGLRKAGATRAAENGASAHQLMAIFGWLNLREAERYTQAAERRKLAGAAIQLMARRSPKLPAPEPSHRKVRKNGRK
jgi:integrase